MLCNKCGANFPDGAKFCPQCGASVAADSGRSEPEPPVKAAVTGPRDPYRSRGPIPDVPEETLWEGSYDPRAMYGQWLCAALFTVFGVIGLLVFARGDNVGWFWGAFLLAVILLWVGLAAIYAYRRYTVKFRLTNLRFFHEYGLLSRTVERIEVISMDDISFRQGLVERFLNIGNMTIHSSDRTQPELRIAGVKDVRAVADLFDKARRLERQRRGVYVEAM